MVSLAGALSGRGRALASCARVLGMSRQSMQEFVTIGARWNEAEWRRILRLRDAGGAPLGVARLVLLARAPCTARKALLDRVLRERLDVRTLRKLVRLGASET
jgi:hypothetical protein